MKPGLYIIGTPIGNLSDITLRAIETLRGVDFILAEDTRHARILLDRCLTHRPAGRVVAGVDDLGPVGTKTVLAVRPASPRPTTVNQFSSPSLISCHKFNEQSRVEFVLEKIRAGRAIALITNAGMPAVADPGARIAQACRQNGFYVTVIPGPSAVTAAVALSGFGGDGFICEGFLPRKRGQRARRLAQLQDMDMPAVIFESPYRLLTLLAELHEIFQDREIFLGRELTKLNEQCLWGTAAEIKKFFY